MPDPISPAPEPRLSVAVAVATHKRPAGLRRLVGDLNAQRDLPSGVTIRVVVVDNDPLGSARATLNAAELTVPLDYAIENNPGIPAVRRRLVDLSATDDAIIFVDDDESVPPRWVGILVRHWRDSGADVVTGPVRRQLPQRAPTWARTSDMFDPTNRHRTGDRLSKAYTGNTLVSRKVLDAIDVPFDDAFRHTGSSDLHFFLRVHRAGFRIEWCEEAMVVEHIPPARVTWSWFARRAYRSGAGDTIARRLIDPGPRSVAAVMALAVARGMSGLGAAPVGLFKPAYRSFAVRRVFSAVGSMAGLLGHNYEEYRSQHATPDANEEES